MTSVTDPAATAPQLSAAPQADAAPRLDYAYPAGPYPEFPAARPDRVTRLVNRLWTGSPLWVAPIALFACMGAAVGYTYATDPATAGADAVPSCLLKYSTGFVCPGCGGTRAAWYLLHGDLPAAARHHAMFVFALPFLLWMYFAWAARRVFGWQVPQLQLSPAVIGWFLGAWGLWSVLRNLPWSPFTMFFV